VEALIAPLQKQGPSSLRLSPSLKDSNEWGFTGKVFGRQLFNGKERKKEKRRKGREKKKIKDEPVLPGVVELSQRLHCSWGSAPGRLSPKQGV